MACLYQTGHEAAWWGDLNINTLEIAKGLSDQTRPKSAPTDTQQLNAIAAKAATET